MKTNSTSFSSCCNSHIPLEMQHWGRRVSLTSRTDQQRHPEEVSNNHSCTRIHSIIFKRLRSNNFRIEQDCTSGSSVIFKESRTIWKTAIYIPKGNQKIVKNSILTCLKTKSISWKVCCIARCPILWTIYHLKNCSISSLKWIAKINWTVTSM